MPLLARKNPLARVLLAHSFDFRAFMELQEKAKGYKKRKGEG
jgi:hypothetical protein